MLTREEKLKLVLLKREKRIRQARESFWEFCKLLSPFHTEDKVYLKELATDIQEVYERRKLDENGEPYWYMTISLPPRHGKSYTIIMFEAWCLGRNPDNRIATVSFDNPESEKFSGFVRDIIQEEREEWEIDKFVFRDIFPEVRIKYGDSAKQRWSVEGQFSSFRGVGFNGGITGNGYSIMVIDDPHKDSEEAFNGDLLDKKYNKYTGTFKNRLEQGGMRIIIQTRWSKDDLIGRVIDAEEGKHYYHFIRKACLNESGAIAGTETPKMLCERVLNFTEYLERKKDDNEMIFLANYQQELIDLKGALYNGLRHYDRLPVDANGNSLFEDIIAYIDTADKGADYLAGVIAGKYQGFLYILDIIYTQKPMEETEKLLCETLIKNNVNVCIVESNNGGGVYARNIRNMLWEKYKVRKPIIKDFHQSKNKETRILSNAHMVCNNVFFPQNANIVFPEAWKSLKTYKRVGKNAHDDIEDALTGIWEMTSKNLAIPSNLNRNMFNV